MSRRGRLAAAVAAACAPAVWWTLGRDTGELNDLDVYREAGLALRAGLDVYSTLFVPALPDPLPFTYPPFGALLTLPLSVPPRAVLAALWTAATLAALAWVVVVAFRRLLARVGPPGSWPWTLAAAGVTGAAAWLLPVTTTVWFGQVNVLLMAACLADVARTRRWGGALTGLATGIKLTPGLFLVHLWTAGRRRAAVVGAGAFAATVAAGAVALPAESRRYWTELLLDSERVRDNAYFYNQSLRGLLLRADLAEVWLPLALAVAVAGLWRARSAALAGDRVAAATLTGLTAVAVSPVSWIHHAVWVVPAVGVLLADARDRRRLAAAGALVALLLTRAPYWGDALIDGHGWSPAYAVLENSLGVAVLVLVATLPFRRAAARDTEVRAPAQSRA